MRYVFEDETEQKSGGMQYVFEDEVSEEQRWSSQPPADPGMQVDRIDPNAPDVSGVQNLRGTPVAPGMATEAPRGYEPVNRRMPTGPTFTAPEDPRTAMLDAGLVDSDMTNNFVPWAKAGAKGIAHAVTSTAPAMVNAAARQFVDRSRALNEAGATGLIDSDYEVETPEYTRNFLKNLSDRFGVGADVWTASGKPLELPPTATEGEKRAWNVGESLGLVGAAIPFGATGGPVALGIGTSGQKYNELLEAGVEPERAHKAALISGVAETIPELFSFRIGLSKNLPFLKKAIFTQVSELLGESATSATQLGADLWALNPDATREQIAAKYAEEIGDTLQETAVQTLIQTPIQAAGFHAVSKTGDLKIKTAETIKRIREKLNLAPSASVHGTPVAPTTPVGREGRAEAGEGKIGVPNRDIQGLQSLLNQHGIEIREVPDREWDDQEATYRKVDPLRMPADALASMNRNRIDIRKNNRFGGDRTEAIAHEGGHLLDNKFGIMELLADADIETHKELAYAGFGLTTAGKPFTPNHEAWKKDARSGNRNGIVGEATAQAIGKWLVNPQKFAEQFPRLAELFESKIAAAEAPVSAISAVGPKGRPEGVQGQEQPTAQAPTDIEENVPRGAFPTPLDVAREHALKDVEEGHVSPQAAEQIVKNIAYDAGMPSYYGKEVIRPYFERIFKHSQQTGQEVSSTDLDIGHVAGMNAELGHNETNKHMRAISEIIKDMFDNEIGAERLVYGRHGGDEMKVLGLGVPKSDLDRAAQRAKIEVEKYVDDNDLRGLTAEKELADGSTVEITKDVSLHVNTESMTGFRSVDDFLKVNDAKRIVKGVDDELRGGSKEARPAAPKREPASPERGRAEDYRQARAETATQPAEEVTPQYRTTPKPWYLQKPSEALTKPAVKESTAESAYLSENPDIVKFIGSKSLIGNEYDIDKLTNFIDTDPVLAKAYRVWQEGRSTGEAVIYRLNKLVAESKRPEPKKEGTWKPAPFKEKAEKRVVFGEKKQKATTQKEPWEMNRAEWEQAIKRAQALPLNADAAEELERLSYGIADGEGSEGENREANHRDVVEKAFSEGKPISENVLKEYGLSAKIPPMTPKKGAGEIPTGKPESKPEGGEIALDIDGNKLVDMDGVPMSRNSDGTITLYHRTTPKNAERIKKTGVFTSKENTNETFFSNKLEGQGEGYGDAVIAVKVRPSDVRINDAFHNGEIHVAVSNKKLSKKNIIPEPSRPPKEGGQVVPSRPETAEVKSRFDSDIRQAIKEYESPEEGKDITFDDMMERIEGIAEDSDDPRARDILNAVEVYRDAATEDREEWGMRGDMEAEEEKFMEAVKSALPKGRVAAKPRPRNQVEKSLYKGEEVTEEELAKYPELAKKYGKKAAPAKQPWEMTREEWMKQRPAGTSPGMHSWEVKQALNEGKPVPSEVLKDYPDLMEKYKAGRGGPGAKPLAESAEKTAKTIDDFIDTSGPKAGLSVRPAIERKVDDTLNLPGGEVKSVNPEVEGRWQASKGIARKTILSRIKESFSHAWEQRKHFPGLDYKKDARSINALREFENVPEFSKKTAAEVTSGIVAGMGPKKYDVFTRNIILPDLVKDIENGLYDDRDLPFGYKDKAEIEQDYSNFKAIAGANPDIQAALKRRTEFNAVLKSQLVENELLPKEVLKDDAYFHHQVLMYMEAKNAAPGVSSKDVRTHKKGFQKGRTGSAKDFNTEYIESEFEYVAQAISQLKTVETLKRIRTIADIALEVKKQAREQGLDNWRKAIPEGYTTWQPKPGTMFYRAVAIPERLVDEILSGKLAEVSKEDLKEIIAKGARNPEWVIPERLAKTLDNFRDFPDEGFDRFARATVASWKQWVLLNPLRVLKYNINNMSGDLDIAIAYDPRILKYFRAAAGEAWGHYKGRAMTKDMREALEYGVVGSGISLHEIPDIKEIGVFRILTGKNPGLVEKYWQKAKGLTTARENILRLAAYKYFKDQIAAGEKVYGVSVIELVDAERDPHRKAALLARDLIGDYGNISKAGQWLRQRMMPFFSWQEINAPRYVRLVRNLAKEERAGTTAAARIGAVAAGKAAKTTAKLAVKASGLYALVMLWNATAAAMLDISDDEKRAIYKDREQMHIILGRRDDGTIITLRFQGALSDMLDWVGLGNAPAVAEDLAKGRKTIGEQLKESAKAPINRIVNASHPILKTVGEIMTGKTIYPDVFNPRPIRDRVEHAMRAITADLPYDYIAGKPKRGPSKDVLSIIAYSNDPAEAAYWNTRKTVYEFLDKQGHETASYTPTKRSNAMYYYKQARRFGDDKAAEKFLREYVELGGTLRGFMESAERSSPLGSLPAGIREDFEDSLSTEERRDMEIAEEWYERHMEITEDDLDMLEDIIDKIEDKKEE